MRLKHLDILIMLVLFSLGKSLPFYVSYIETFFPLVICISCHDSYMPSLLSVGLWYVGLHHV